MAIAAGQQPARPDTPGRHAAPEVADELMEALRTRYAGNLAALYEQQPDLAVRVDALPFDPSTKLEPAHDGQWTIRRPADDGALVFVHSRHQPSAEAARQVAAREGESASAWAVIGCGLGYVVDLLVKRSDQPLVVLCESDLTLLKAAFCLHDWSAAVRARRLLILCDPAKSAVHALLTPRMAELLLGFTMLPLPHTARCHARAAADFRALLTEYIAFAKLQLVTLLKINRQTFRNIARNTPAYLASPGVGPLRHRAAGYPAIIVAAGPSLAGHLRPVIALRDRAVVIAVQTVFRQFCALRARPHFVTSLDYHEISADFFEGVDSADPCVLVAEPKVAWQAADRYPGRICMLTNALYDRLLRGSHTPRTALKAGSTVAHLAFYLAEHLGCDPIIFVGQDLCFSQGLFYPPGTPVEDAWQPELGRFQTVEGKHWERIVRNRHILRRVQDYAGRETYADDLLNSYAEQFEAEFARSQSRVLLAAPTGRKLAHADVQSLSEIAEQYCTRPLPEHLLSLPNTDQAGYASACNELRARIDEVRAVQGIATKTDGLLAQLQELVSRPAEFNRLLVRVDELRLQMPRYDATYRLIVDVSALAELRRFNADRRLNTDQPDTPEATRQRLRRDREFVAALLDGCEFLLSELPAALQRLEEAERRCASSQ